MKDNQSESAVFITSFCIVWYMATTCLHTTQITNLCPESRSTVNNLVQNASVVVAHDMKNHYKCCVHVCVRRTIHMEQNTFNKTDKLIHEMR